MDASGSWVWGGGNPPIRQAARAIERPLTLPLRKTAHGETGERMDAEEPGDAESAWVILKSNRKLSMSQMGRPEFFFSLSASTGIGYCHSCKWCFFFFLPLLFSFIRSLFPNNSHFGEYICVRGRKHACVCGNEQKKKCSILFLFFYCRPLSIKLWKFY